MSPDELHTHLFEAKQGFLDSAEVDEEVIDAFIDYVMYSLD